jgi:hypothetical protein
MVTYPMLKIHELIDSRGELSAVYLRVAESSGALELVTAEGSWPLPAGALQRVLERYGAPFDVQARVTPVGELQLGSGESLRHVRHLAGYDVVPRDYLVLSDGVGEGWCAHGASVAGPLLHLARVLAATQRRD